MISKLLHAIAWACIISTSISAQSSYSESNPFERKLPETRRDKDRPPAKPLTASATDARSLVIPLSVLDRTGTPVSVSREDLTVFVDGSAVTIQSFEKPTIPPNVILLVDMSPSAFKRIEDIRTKARAFAFELPAGTKVMVAEFHSQMNVRAQLTDNRDLIEKAISNTKMGDGTSLYTAMQTLSEKVLPAIAGNTVVVLFTDGVDTTSTSSTYRSSVLEVGRSAASIYPVYYETSVDTDRLRRPRLDPFLFPPGTLPTRGIAGMSEREYERGREYLEDLAAVSGGRLLPAAKFDTWMKSLAAELRSKVYLGISVPDTSEARRSVKVRVNRPGLKVVARGALLEK